MGIGDYKLFSQGCIYKYKYHKETHTVNLGKQVKKNVGFEINSLFHIIVDNKCYLGRQSIDFISKELLKRKIFKQILRKGLQQKFIGIDTSRFSCSWQFELTEFNPLFTVEESLGKSVPKYMKNCIQNNVKVKNKGSKKLLEAKIAEEICYYHIRYIRMWKWWTFCARRDGEK